MAQLWFARAWMAGLLTGCGSGSEASKQPAPCQAITDHGNVTVGSGAAGDPVAPTAPTFYRSGVKLVTAHSYVVVTDNPLASRAGCQTLEAGGTAIDAAVAVQMVLGLVAAPGGNGFEKISPPGGNDFEKNRPQGSTSAENQQAVAA